MAGGDNETVPPAAAAASAGRECRGLIVGQKRTPRVFLVRKRRAQANRTVVLLRFNAVPPTRHNTPQIAFRGPWKAQRAIIGWSRLESAVSVGGWFKCWAASRTAVVPSNGVSPVSIC